MRFFKTIISVIALGFIILFGSGCTTTDQKTNTNNQKVNETKQVEPKTTEQVAPTQVAPVEEIKVETPAPTQNTSTSAVKKSSTGICHAPGTTYYNRTTNFTPYNSIDDCLKSGGRLPLK